MKTHIDEKLNPAQWSIYDPLKEEFQGPTTIDEILDHLNTSKNK